ncbi:MAG: 3-phosphoserine/phosphohydroxythreonine transaminase [Deltaproteobacteria bacterium]|nr:MAG: 3-phosphoserine/phosphohydroxythreonine transaminase [Deltaproteobacteria bacterium]
MGKRIYNFNPGPAALPLPVLEEIQAEFLDFRGSGMSITEVSHRSALFDEVINDAKLRVTRLLGCGEDHEVLFLQGGASLQFTMIPMNLLPDDQVADYVNTGSWSAKAIKEAQILGKEVKVVASSEDRDFTYIPKNIIFNENAAYVHITSNNTIRGTQWSRYPDTGNIPLVSDVSSDIMGRPMDLAPFGLIYAGAQKNLGPAGVTLVLIRRDMLDRVPDNLPIMLKYTTFAAKNSMFNTPPCFAIYVVQLVLKWLEETIGGLAKMEQINKEKAALLYNYLDKSEFYRGTADKEDRSVMNVTFRLTNESLEQVFIEQALANGLGGLKGHRSVGGCRASLYNATDLKAVKALVSFMAEFERRYG